ncbi:DNA N6-methyl adenine demethylase-like [Drosophila ananassae]|uniref:DNA N6-methyl adenine demethylase-like n=1 Tax=Drosophila ananassae TaxID=7217 RepID=UPI000177D0B1|nr:DNA N6-methyl adenine demethylase-like [Drosophila ananassae]
MSSSAYISNGIGINYYTANTLQQQQQQMTYLQHAAGGAACSSSSATGSPAHQQQQQQQQQQPLHSGSSNNGSASGCSSIGYPPNDPGLRRRLFAGIRPLSVFGRLRQQRSSQHRSISLPESNYANTTNTEHTIEI